MTTIKPLKYDHEKGRYEPESALASIRRALAAHTPADEIEANRRLDAFMRNYDVRPTRRHACVLALVDRRHRPAWSCDCRSVAPDAWDHSRAWVRRNRPVLVTMEPYDLEEQDVVAVRAAFAPLGLEVTASKAESFWFPGWTTLIVIRPAGGGA